MSTNKPQDNPNNPRDSRGILRRAFDWVILATLVTLMASACSMVYIAVTY